MLPPEGGWRSLCSPRSSNLAPEVLEQQRRLITLRGCVRSALIPSTVDWRQRVRGDQCPLVDLRLRNFERRRVAELGARTVTLTALVAAILTLFVHPPGPQQQRIRLSRPLSDLRDGEAVMITTASGSARLGFILGARVLAEVR